MSVTETDLTAAGKARRLILLLDGTSNEVEQDLSNVLKLYRMLGRGDDQAVYYHPGVGTMRLARSWGHFSQALDTYWGLATGWRLDDNILRAYQFLCERYRDGDEIMIFGFSRGAYTARAVAGLVHVLGLLNEEQLDLAPHALTAYKRSGSESDLNIAWRFRKVIGGRRVTIRFLGLWDSVASVIVPRRDRFYLPSLEFLPYTKVNPSVEIVRHACAIDEKRRMFRLLPWEENQDIRPDPFGPVLGKQDSETVWFAGDHSDVGGGYPEAQSQAAKFPLLWITREAEAAGARLKQSMVEHLALGTPLPGGDHAYVEPDETAPLHNSMRGLWHILEWIPKNGRWRQWPKTASRRGFYLPRSELRPIPDGATIHRSVIERMEKTGYRPVNLPERFAVTDTRTSPTS